MTEQYSHGAEWYPAKQNRHMNNTQPDGCEVCDYIGPDITVMYGNMWVCSPCREKELALQEANKTPEAQNDRINQANELMNLSREIDTNIEMREDLFNAKTVSIKELKDAIQADDSITNKPYALALILKERFEHFTKVIFDTREILVEAGNTQRAIHSYMATLSNQLRAEEREKLKLVDINYNPEKPKVIKPKADRKGRVVVKRFDMAKITELLKPYNNPAMTTESIRIVMTSRGMTEEQAIGFMAKTLGLTN